MGHATSAGHAADRACSVPVLGDERERSSLLHPRQSQAISGCQPPGRISRSQRPSPSRWRTTIRAFAGSETDDPMPDEEQDQPAPRQPRVHRARTGTPLTGGHRGSGGGGQDLSSGASKAAVKAQSTDTDDQSPKKGRKRRLLWALLAVSLLASGGSMAIYLSWEALR